jgi:dTDP-4-amino-4,6-dideoxygalactose transaminase
MTIPLVDLKAQYLSIKDEIDSAIARVVENTSFILGPEVEAFEKEFADFCESEHCIGCASGTDAIALALQGLGVGPGDEVITVSFTFIATAEAVTMVGARPVFVDVRDDTLLMDVPKIEAAITPRTKAILPVHLYGQMADMDPLMEIADKHGLKVVEDAAQAHGARYKGRRAGTIGDAAAFSFYPGKNLGAYGDAGAVVTGDGELATWLRKARDHGRESKYEHDFESRSSRMDGLQAAVLMAKLKHLEEWNERRRKIAGYYSDLIRGMNNVYTVKVSSDCESVYHLYVLRVTEREVVLKKLHERGIRAGVHYPIPLHMQGAYRHLGVTEGHLSVSEKASSNILSLPLFPELSEDSAESVVGALEEARR